MSIAKGKMGEIGVNSVFFKRGGKKENF